MLKNPIALIFLLALIACESDPDGIPDSTNTNTNTSTNINTNSSTTNTAQHGLNAPNTLRGVNGTATGKLFIADEGKYLDLDTGETVTLSRNKVSPRADGVEYLEIIDDYGETTDSCGDDVNIARINIRNMSTGLLDSTFTVPQNLWRQVLLSPDGQSIAYLADELGNCRLRPPLVWFFRNRQGELLHTDSGSMSYIDYLADGRLVALLSGDMERQIGVETEPGSFKFEMLMPLPATESFVGSVGFMDVSADGKHAVFELVTDTPTSLSSVQFREATVWQADLQNGELSMLATTSRDGVTDPKINKPIYSPDGQSVLLTEDYISGAAISYYGSVGDAGTIVTDVSVVPVLSDDLTYIIDANQNNVQLPPARYTNSVRPLLGIGERGLSTPVRINPFQSLIWVPASTGADTQFNGSLPASNGLVNRGFSGTLHGLADNASGDRSVLRELDFATNTFLDTPINWPEASGEPLDELGGELTVSTDGSLYAIADYQSDENNARLIVVRNDGTLLRSDSLRTESFDIRPREHLTRSGFLHFSPDGQYLAWPYRERRPFEDYDHGYEGVVVLNITNNELHILDDKPWSATGWRSNGDHVLIDDGAVYISTRTDDGFLQPTLLFELKDTIRNLSFSPDGTRIVFMSDNNIYTAAADGSDIVRVVAPTDMSFRTAHWSPDGRYIAARCHNSDATSLCIFAADARNVRVYPDAQQPGVMLIGEGAESTEPFDRGPFWR